MQYQSRAGKTRKCSTSVIIPQIVPDKEKAEPVDPAFDVDMGKFLFADLSS
jgi:hypothetical protein